jgi:coproporphyrinogen III oxidase
MKFEDEVSSWFATLQDEICMGLEKIDGGKFREDKWERTGGGGGLTRILAGGKIIEKGGVNFSAVHGKAPDFLRIQNGITDPDAIFFATGVSIVMHPLNPFVPIIHMNVRYLQVADKGWFGGGIDLTPHYVDTGDAEFFHAQLKHSCDIHGSGLYERFKANADDYFFIKHRNETRGIGGIFFDQLAADNTFSANDHFDFVKSVGQTFLPVYTELIKRNAGRSFDERSKKWQRIRRGRYVEFNLVYDKGTKFGLDTDGRTESILMSLPPVAEWEYDFRPEEGSAEAETLSYLKKGIHWVKR